MSLFVSVVIVLPCLTGCSTPSNAPIVLTANTNWAFYPGTFGQGKKVFAHYMPNFPISFDNKSPDVDYYTTQYLSPTGENGAHAAYGGYLRDRPLGRAPISSAAWKLEDLRTEVEQARSEGIDGFAVDIPLTSTQTTIPSNILQVASETSDFRVMVTPDMNGTVGALSASDFASEFATYLQSAGAYRLADGRPVLGAFRAEAKSVSWWTNVLSLIATKVGRSIAFVPTLLNASSNLDAFSTISYGLSGWGGARSPSATTPVDSGASSPVGLVQRAHALGKIWMQPVAFQDNRPRAGIYDEAENTTTLRNSWQIAREQNAEWVQLITWNDYAETTSFAPSRTHGWKLLDLNAFWLAWFKSGVQPTVVRDLAYLTHRIQRSGASPIYPQTKLMQLSSSSSAARDTVEVVTFTSKASLIAVTTGGKTNYCRVGTGMNVCTFQVGLGKVSAGIYRDGSWVYLTASKNEVVSNPYVQDLQYYVAGGNR
ncbi:glycoside hydrolase family 71 protein [Gordonia sp. NPDC003422]